MKKHILASLSYILVTFPLAVIWHVALFESLYKQFGYFDSEPNFALGLLTIIIQGIMLAILYPHFSCKGSAHKRALTYAFGMGIFFWTSHVLAFVAKQEVLNAPLFIGMESLYLMLQFGIFGVLLGYIYKK